MTTPGKIFQYWDKARPSDGGPDHHLLGFHCLDVAAVGWAYLQQAPALVQWVQERLGTSNREATVSWIVFWLAVHDLGEFSISFQGQRPDLVSRLQGVTPSTLGLPDVRHDSLGMWLWDEAVQPIAKEAQWFGGDPDIECGLPYWVRAVMGHHGQPPLEQARAMCGYVRTQDSPAMSIRSGEQVNA